MLASYLIDPERHSHALPEVARFELGLTVSDAEELAARAPRRDGKLAAQSIESTAASAAALVAWC